MYASPPLSIFAVIWQYGQCLHYCTAWCFWATPPRVCSLSRNDVAGTYVVGLEISRRWRRRLGAGRGRIESGALAWIWRMRICWRLLCSSVIPLASDKSSAADFSTPLWLVSQAAVVSSAVCFDRGLRPGVRPPSHNKNTRSERLAPAATG